MQSSERLSVTFEMTVILIAMKTISDKPQTKLFKISLDPMTAVKSINFNLFVF